MTSAMTSAPAAARERKLAGERRLDDANGGHQRVEGDAANSPMADQDSPATWEMGVPRSEGYVIELHRLMRRLRYPRFPIYRVRQCGSVWEARVEVHTRVTSELDYSFPTRHRRDLPETAMQDAAREAFLRLSSIH
uniref:OSJNBa0059H15.16 protein n=1 Tax=Oryza sativa subsp. japonica TaxID=39947 RepID=Q7XXH3_ORYSJ|nr:OSJNBa0059H15.16 [Oryza sativa Japonica Group]CAE04952.1 OSJNBa0070D17.3 [Oryza sativa Japonica Group]